MSAPDSNFPDNSTANAVECDACSAFLLSLVSTADARNQINTAEKAQDLIDRFEEVFDHGEMPPAYDWLITRRDRLHSQNKEISEL